ncbi:hypothetical protein GGR54DRAFT_288500 [Hypoxylon sp. NC1633]|nr:hypothetical protein GGR54DRAFT_288500 [Hypoxylon sp. NC1633]
MPPKKTPPKKTSEKAPQKKAPGKGMLKKPTGVTKRGVNQKKNTPAVEGVRGTILPNGLFQCGMIRANGAACSSRVQNKARSIRSHIIKGHQHHSAYQRDQDRTYSWPCKECNKQYPNFHAFLGHHRQVHGFRGKSEGLRRRAYADMGHEDGEENEADGQAGADTLKHDHHPGHPRHRSHDDDEDDDDHQHDQSSGTNTPAASSMAQTKV